MMNRLFLTLSLLICVAMPASVLAFQGGKRDSAPPSVPTTASPSTKTPRRRIAVVKRSIPNNPKSDDPKNANLAIRVTPPDSVITLNDQQVSNSGSGGNLALTNLKPGSYVLTVRHAGYGDLVRQIDLKPNENDPINITLEPLKGTLSVKPNVSGSSIGLRSIDPDVNVGEYAGAIEHIDIQPGEYEVTVSKPGYQSTSRRFSLKAGGTVELEPGIDPLPAPTPTPQVVIAPRSSVTMDGKYLVVRFVGTTGNAAQTSGTVNVTVNRGMPIAYVQGSLNGLPCNVSFDPLDNIAEGSLVDNPSASNAWSLIGVRIRPKDPKRPINFSVNWSSVTASNQPIHEAQDKGPPTSDAVTKAVPIHRAVPTVPSLARSSRTKGVVKVTVEVDEQGDVKSAKAFDGPIILRQAAEDAAREWKFKPATRNGKPTRSTEVIYFTFEGY